MKERNAVCQKINDSYRDVTPPSVQFSSVQSDPIPNIEFAFIAVPDNSAQYRLVMKLKINKFIRGWIKYK